MKTILSFSQNEKGLSLIELSIAAAVGLSAIGLLSVALVSTGRAQEQSQAISRMIMLESALVNSMTSQQTYSANANLKDQMTRHEMPALTDISLDLCGERVNGVCDADHVDLRISPGESICLARDSSLISRTACNFLNPNHFMQVTVALRLFSDDTFRYSYSIMPNNNEATLATLGSVNPAALNDADYLVSVPRDAYSNLPLFNCDPANTFGSRGFDSHTGQIECIGRSNTRCADGTLPKRLTYNANTNEVEMDCGTVAQTVSCPSNYSIHRFNPASLEADQVKSGTCAFITVNQQPWPTPFTGSGSYTGVVCPPNYRLSLTNSTCTMVETRNVPGACPRIDWQLQCDPEYLDTVTNEYVEVCRYVNAGALAPTRVPANVGSVRLRAQPDPRAVSCVLTIPGQQCGSQWEGYANMTVSCDLVPPTETPAL